MRDLIRNAAYPLIVICLTVIACIFYWASLLDTQLVEMEAARHRGEMRVQQLNEGVDLQLDATLRSIDIALRHLRTDYLHSRKDFDRSVRETLAAYPQGMLRFVSVVGADGYLTYLSELKPDAKPDHVFFGDREHFQVHADSDEDNLFISEPIFGRIVKTPLIQITRPIWEGNKLVGVIGIPLSPEYLSNSLGALNIDPHDLISIVREDGRIIARSRKLEEGLKLTTPSDRPFMHSHSGEHGIFRNVSITDQVPLLFSWRHLAHYPIIAVTAVDEVAELSGVTEQQSNTRKRTLQAMVLVVAFAIWISLLIIRGNRKNHELALSEGSLLKSEARSRIMLNNEMVGIVTVKDRIIQWANPAFEKMLGYGKGEMIGTPTRQNFMTEDAYKSLGESAYPLLSEGKIFRAEIEHRHKNGSQIWVDLSGSMMNSETCESLWAFIDITERKQKELELRKFKSIVDSSDDAIISKSLDGIIKSWNHGAEKIFGYTADEAVGSPILMLIPPDYYQEESEIMARIARGETIEQYETVRRHKDGRLINISTTISPILDNEGKVTGASKIARDITDHLRAESELRIAATAFESQEGMSVTDANGTILRVNQAFTSITGYSAEEIIGKTPKLLKSGRHDANFYATMWESINSTGLWEGEIWNRRKNGEVYPEHLTITAVKNADGTVSNYVSTLTDITLTKAAENEIKHLAFYDALTRLPNRRLLLDRLRQALASIMRSGRTGALLFIDLDNFKTLNDTLGHDIGDLLLQQVARRLESCVREGDTVARLGGDEFVIMLEDLSKDSLDAAEQTESVGIKVLSTLNRPYQLATHEHHNTPSIGATLFNDNRQSIDELMKQADIAMYQSKKAGRNTLRFFDPKMQDAINARASLESELHKALENKQFQLFYQLQVDGLQGDGSHRPLGAEALIRWIHPEQGVISPARFIPLAEETGLILLIGQWVLETACAQLETWKTDTATRSFALAVNVSAKQFRQPDFVDQVKAVLKNHAINPGLLKLELTESLLLEDIEDTIAKMNALREIGVLFSLDDFGTGYSSLQYLKRLPLDQLKIDQSFVRDIALDSSDKAIVRTIIAMARSLNLNYIAEGVETEEQSQLLLNMGCTHYQGYLFGKPMPINEFDALLKPQINMQ